MLATVTDKKVGQDTSSDGMADYYMARTETASFYADYGWGIVGRQINPNSSRLGQNGQEKSLEIDNGHYTAEFWEYDARSTRRWNVDPRPNLSMSPYSVFGGNPIYNRDPKGDTIFKEKIDRATKNIAIIHIKEVENDLQENWKGEMEGWSYVVTDDLEDAEKWLNANFTSEEVENLGVRLHSAGSSGDVTGIATWDAEGRRSDTNPFTLKNQKSSGFAFDKAQQDALVGIVSKVNEGGTVVLSPCSLASGASGEGNVDLDFVLGMSKIAKQSSITIMMNTVESSMYDAFNTGLTDANLNGVSNPHPWLATNQYTWIKYQRIKGDGTASSQRYSVSVTSYMGFDISAKKNKN